MGPYDDEEEADVDETWVVLLHAPGPNAPGSGSLMDDPRIRDHFAFLARMQEQGYLVAAGPLPDADGEGMTVLRLPGGGRLADAERLAREDDVSVAGGFLSVRVRPWNVALHTLG